MASASVALPAPRPVPLVWHVETLDGEVVESRRADEPINPASVVKVATTWWALERLGPAHRFDTRIVTQGTIDPERGVLRGDLIVEGSGDPDFHVENAFLVAAALNELHVRRIEGDLRVSETFWIGWEGASYADPDKRGRLMAARLLDAWDPKRWDRVLQLAWERFAARRGLDAASPPSVVVAGRIRPGSDGGGDTLLVHRSGPLVEILRRFNAYSNNDIERFETTLGPPARLQRALAARWGVNDDRLRFESTSGLGVNRMTARLVVRLLRELRATTNRLGLAVESVLPVAGCDPGTLPKLFPALSAGDNATSLVGKTGTLAVTDGGVSILAGFLRTGNGDLVFCVAAPRSGRAIRSARRAEQQFVIDLLGRNDGPRARPCLTPLAESDVRAETVPVPPAARAGIPERSDDAGTSRP